MTDKHGALGLGAHVPKTKTEALPGKKFQTQLYKLIHTTNETAVCTPGEELSSLRRREGAPACRKLVSEETIFII